MTMTMTMPDYILSHAVHKGHILYISGYEQSHRIIEIGRKIYEMHKIWLLNLYIANKKEVAVTVTKILALEKLDCSHANTC